ncbi:outer membrane beta-barrel protein [Acaryochloris sp. IP29b_bin.137]|uniref:outer membrane beta-barrel protein n=1 Tax=Acaryochloris sp. IP29b_bin.137 TaxID=2969217 RepID=UPI0026394F39|nr:outer membrane beta-barrel protein [Acaryochloris sp. IP29b_bin.137]
MHNSLVLVGIVSSWLIWDLNRITNAKPKPIADQTEINYSSKKSDSNYSFLSKKRFLFENHISPKKSLRLYATEDPGTSSTIIKELDKIGNNSEPGSTTYSSHSAVDLLQHIPLQADSTLTEERSTDFPTPPPPPPDQLFTPGKSDVGLRPVSKQKKKYVRLKLRSSVNTTSGIAATIPARTQFTNSATLQATPKLGAKTNLIGEIEGRFIRFTKSSGFNSINTKLGLQQRFGNKTIGQLGWVRRDVFGVGSTNDLVENAAQLTLYREDLLTGVSANKLTLNSQYDFLTIFTSTMNSDRFSHRIGLNLNYDLAPKLTGQLGYRVIIDDFIGADNLDIRHQLSAKVTYNFNRQTFLSGSFSYLFGSLTFGDDKVLQI